MAYKPLAMIEDICGFLRQIVNMLSRPVWINPSTGVLRTEGTSTVSIAATQTLNAVTTVATVTTMTQIGGIPAVDSMLYLPTRQLWATAIRTRIT